LKLKIEITLWFLIVILVVIISGIFLSLLISAQIKHNEIESAKINTAEHIKLHANSFLTTDDFLAENYDEKDKTFTDYFRIIETPYIIRIKVWSLEGTIVYSDSKDIVGVNFHDNPTFQQALNGEVVAAIKPPVKPENIAEAGYEQLMEVYVPIFLSDGNFAGVIEIYTSLDNVNLRISEANNIILPVVAISVISIVAVLVVIYFYVNRNIIKPIISLQNASVQVSKGNLDARINKKYDNELGELADSFNSMIESIKKNASLEKELSEEKLKKERLTAIGELSSNIAHEIRNPLYAIQNSIQIIGKRVRNKISKNEIQRMNRSILRITHQIDQVLEFVRATPLKVEKLSLNHVLETLIQSIDVPKNITIKLSASDVDVNIDHMKMDSVFYNILLNAIQAIENNKGTITIRTFEKNGIIKIEFKNDGPDIPEDVLSKVFEPLFSTKQKGTGLGLSGAKNIVEQHGGTISVKSHPVTFTVKLPKKLKIQGNDIR